MRMETRSGWSSCVKGCESADTSLDDALDLRRVWSSSVISRISLIKTLANSRSSVLATLSITTLGRLGGRVHGVTVLCDPRIWNGVVVLLALKTRKRTEHAGQHRLDTPIIHTAGICSTECNEN